MVNFKVWVCATYNKALSDVNIIFGEMHNLELKTNVWRQREFITISLQYNRFIHISI